ncbi:MAG TPA: hypothetical protein VMZ28_15505 [Kofleriaceae bacterium]|nr:hypothetical protein [Kofleriaceae bacterium]
MRSLGVVVLLLTFVALPGDVGAARLGRAQRPTRSQRRLTPRPRRAFRLRRQLLRPPPHRSKVLLARTTAKTVVDELTPNRRLSDLSIAALTLSGAPGVRGPSNINLPLHLDVFTGLSGIALSVASLVDYRRALDGPGKADAAHGLAWGLQSLAALAGNAVSSPLLQSASTWLGVGGGAIQSGLGLYRLKDGLARRDRRVTILGALDLVSGVSWIASTVSFNPVALGVFLASTGVRVVYANAGLLKQVAQRHLRSTRDLLSSRPSSKEAGRAAE